MSFGTRYTDTTHSLSASAPPAAPHAPSPSTGTLRPMRTSGTTAHALAVLLRLRFPGSRSPRADDAPVHGRGAAVTTENSRTVDVSRTLSGDAFDPPLTEPQGIARDPRTGHLLVVDDWEGTNSLYELDPEGRLLGTTPLIAYGRDPEGIAIRAGANLVFMAFDGGARIAAFDYVPTVGAGAEVPRPGADCMIS